MAVFTWGMLVRAFNPPGGVEDYDFLRWFLLRLNAIGFILICVILFEGESVLTTVKRAVALVTLFAVPTFYVGLRRRSEDKTPPVAPAPAPAV